MGQAGGRARAFQQKNRHVWGLEQVKKNKHKRYSPQISSGEGKGKHLRGNNTWVSKHSEFLGRTSWREYRGYEGGLTVGLSPDMGKDATRVRGWVERWRLDERNSGPAKKDGMEKNHIQLIITGGSS